MQRNERLYPIPLGIKQYLKKYSSHNKNLGNNIRLDSETIRIRRILSTGPSEENYKNFFHCMLWLEECEQLEQNEPEELQLSCTVEISKMAVNYSMRIPKDEQKRIYLKIGDTLKLSRVNGNDCITVNVEEIIGTFVMISGIGLLKYDLENKKWDVKITLTSDSFEKMHAAIDHIHTNMKSYIFPKETIIKSNSIQRYFNANIKSNLEQRTAVEHIVSRQSGAVPFLLIGPPGTGKTVTIVEAILQLVVSNTRNYVLVCAHSNTAVDNVTRVLQKYKKDFNGRKLFVRINSKSRNRVAQDLREDCLYSPVQQDVLMGYRIILCTLNHSSRYNLDFITHVVIDEAAQTTEPSSFIPLGQMNERSLSFIRPTARRPLILAGDDKQLEAVVVSKEAKRFGFGTSLMERLIKTCPIYNKTKGSNFMVILKNNYRSSADIIDLPNRLFYDGHLRALAAVDPLSVKNILIGNKTCGGVVFHKVLSTEVKNGTSYHNCEEFDIVKLYVVNLMYRHDVKQEDIGIITPYKNQVNLINNWIKEHKWRINVESVDAFQGQEKRVIIISTVRGKAEETDATLGFVTDVKRFNVALTRAKAKAIVVGNPVSLRKSPVWEAYIQKCRKLGTLYPREEYLSCTPSSSYKVAQDLQEDCLYSPVQQDVLMGYRIILCTLNHSSRYDLDFITHVVIDEAAQTTEPSSFIPLGQMKERSLSFIRPTAWRPLILAGDDKQLEAVVLSKEAKRFGFGTSLMERLIKTCPIYNKTKGSNFMVILKNNYRSSADIIDLPNRLFYDGHLRALAAVDPLSVKNILIGNKTCGGVVFHKVLSTEVKNGTSYHNCEEFDIVKLYVVNLMYRHDVKQEDIGIITPYKNQVNLINNWIKEHKWRINVESVDAFQGQEKRVIIISTVRGKAEETDATLGFVTDVKRFNVALTRAKAKAIVVGNPVSLRKSPVWKAYIQKCRQLGTLYPREEYLSCTPSSSYKWLSTAIYIFFTKMYVVIITILVYLKLRAPSKEF